MIVLAVGPARAQELSILDSFADTSVTNDGAAPNSSLVEDSLGNFYGTTSGGGSAGHGTVFKIAPGGTVTILHSFGVSATALDGSTVADGANPSGNLILANDGSLYGTTSSGGSAGYGTVYKISTTGTYTIVHSFAAGTAATSSPPNLSAGVYPEAGVIQGQDGNFYGTTSQGGASGLGTVFQLKVDGTCNVIHSFGATGDAASPSTGLVQDAQGNLYGTTAKGGTAGMGAVYRIDAQFNCTVIYNFVAATTTCTFTLSAGYALNRPGGFSPNSSLVIGNDGNLYGTASGTTYGTGAVYQVTPQGQFTVLHYFGDGSVPNDGAEYPGNVSSSASLAISIGAPFAPPAGPLTLGADGNFYGTTYNGGINNGGVVFEMTPTGQVTIIHRFGDGTVANDGLNPVGLMQGADRNFYGATSAGGAAGKGTAFKITTTLPEFTSPLQVAAALGQPFTYQMAATQGPVTYSVGTLPTGFRFDAGTGVISGTPTATGILKFTLTATNAGGSDTAPLVVTVYASPVITSLLNVVGSTSGLSYQIRATQSPTSFAATGLPPGVLVDPASGMLYGLPTQPGTYQVTISATNPVGTGTAVVTVNILSSAPTLAQEYSLIHSFGSVPGGGEGTFPGPMILGADGTFFGVTSQGGVNGGGTVFNLSAAGQAQVIASLGGANGSSPQGIIQAPDGTLYGTAQSGGSANQGTIFKITPDGTFVLLHTFGDNSVTPDGANPQCGLVLASDGNFYGTTQYGGTANQGTVYQMTPAGVVTILHSFGDTSVTNDGAQPVAALVQDPGVLINGETAGQVTLLGTTLIGGAQSVGTAFLITSGGAVQIVHSFGDPTVAGDGQLPHASLFIDLNDPNRTIYGTTMAGGSIGKGTVFALNFSRFSITILHSFGDGSVPDDGENPISPLVAGSPETGYGLVGLSPPTLYGTTQNGGTAGQGTLFSCLPNVAASTSTTTILHNFGDAAVPNDGTMPLGGVCLGADGNVYGTTVGGGSGSGTAYGMEINQGNGQFIVPPSEWTCTGTIPAGMTFDPDTGTLSGTPLATNSPGLYSLTITQYALGAVQGTPQKIALKLTEPFSMWVSSHSVEPGSLTDPGADGVPNLLKCLCDLDPNAPMGADDHAALPTLGMDTTTTPGTTYLTMTYRSNPGVVGLGVTLQTSSDLQTWSTVNSPAIFQQVGTDTTTGDPMMEIGVVAAGAPQFIRLNVKSP